MMTQSHDTATRGPLFPLGALLFTRSIDDLVREGQIDAFFYLHRHLCGDWGDIDAEDWAANNMALHSGDRLLSAYQVTEDLRFWIITEADRSVTTLLLPDEC